MSPRRKQESDGRGRRLDFLVAGVQKGGTSSLHGMLTQHPQIARIPTKEFHFFDSENKDWANPNYRKYHRRVTWQDGAVVAGEFTPNYVFWPGAMERIKQYNPQMRLVLSFRDPVERAFSQWCMVKDRRTTRRGPNPDFAEAIRAVRPTSWPQTAVEAGAPNRAFVGRGYYGGQLARVLELFPAEQVLLLDYHRLFKDLRASLDRITDHLGIDRFADLPEELRERTQPQQLDAAPPTEDDIAGLVELYRADLAVFQTLSGMDVSAWSTARVISGELSAGELAARLAAKATFTKDPAVPAQPDVAAESEPRAG